MRVASLRKPESRRPECTVWMQVRSARGELGEHLDAQIGDEAVAEIGHGDVGDIFGDRLDDGHDHDGGGDPVDHLLRSWPTNTSSAVLLDEEGDGAGGRRGEQHGDGGEQQEPDAGAQMLPPDAHDDLARGVIVGLELVRAPRDHARVAEQLIFQALPRFPPVSAVAATQPGGALLACSASSPLRRKT